MPDRYFLGGCYMAVVTEAPVDDKSGLNTVRAKLVSAGDKGIELNPAPVLTECAGENYGKVSLPKVGDFVIILFLGGDIRRPVILGSIPTPTRKPPVEVDKNNNTRVHKTADGIEITIDENENKSSINIKTKNGHIFTWEDSSDNNLINLKSKDGKTSVSIDLKKSAVEIKAQTISLNADKEINFKSGGSSIKISDSGIESKSSNGKFAVQANQINNKANSKVGIEANASIDLKGTGGINIKSNAVTQVGGSLVKIG